MEVVAQHLQEQALTRVSGVERDQFARSSFNRFYYSAFLRVRAGLANMSPHWLEIAHADMPELIRKGVTGSIKKLLAQAKRGGDGELAATCSFAIKAANELADLLDEGRMTRVTADYRPDEQVDFSKLPDFSLNAVTVKSARTWPRRADLYMSAIEKAWRQIDER